MESVKALHWSKLNPRKIKISDNKSKKSNFVTLNYGDSGLITQTPFMEVHDISKAGKNNEIIVVRLRTFSDNKTENVNIENFCNKINKIEEVIENQMGKLAPSILDVKNNKEFTFKTLITPSKNRSEKLIKLIMDETIIVIDEDKNTTDYKSIEQNDKIKVVIDLSSIWIGDKKDRFGICCKAKKIMLKKTPVEKKFDYEFDDSDTSSSDDNDESIISVYTATECKGNNTEESVDIEIDTNNAHPINLFNGMTPVFSETMLGKKDIVNEMGNFIMSNLSVLKDSSLTSGPESSELRKAFNNIIDYNDSDGSDELYDSD